MLRTVSADRLRLVDGAIALWVAVWLVMGAATAVSVWRLGELGATLSRSGQALDDAGDALQQLGKIPVVGDRPEQLGNDVRQTAADITVRGQEARREMRRLAVLLGLTVALLPSGLVLGPYLPRRLARRRVVREVERRLRTDPDDPALDRYLAEQAVLTLPPAQLLDRSAGAAGEDSSGRVRALADAELGRIGLRR